MSTVILEPETINIPLKDRATIRSITIAPTLPKRPASIALPFVIDPQGKLAAAVKADYDLGVRLGVHQTPTVWIVTDKHGVTNATEVTDFSKLYSMLDAAMAATGGK